MHSSVEMSLWQRISLQRDLGVVGRAAEPGVPSVSELLVSFAVEMLWLTFTSLAGHMANNQPFFPQLAKQIATLEGGGG